MMCLLYVDNFCDPCMLRVSRAPPGGGWEARFSTSCRTSVVLPNVSASAPPYAVRNDPAGRRRCQALPLHPSGCAQRALLDRVALLQRGEGADDRDAGGRRTTQSRPDGIIARQRGVKVLGVRIAGGRRPRGRFPESRRPL